LKNLKKQQQRNRAYKSPLLTEELLEKLKLSKTKHKNLWKFYRNPSERTMIRHYARLLAHYRIKVITMPFKRESPQKPTKPIRSSTISTNGTTVTFLTTSGRFDGS
jgi:hypothetical protein